MIVWSNYIVGYIRKIPRTQFGDVSLDEYLQFLTIEGTVFLVFSNSSLFNVSSDIHAIGLPYQLERGTTCSNTEAYHGISLQNNYNRTDLLCQTMKQQPLLLHKCYLCYFHQSRLTAGGGGMD